MMSKKKPTGQRWREARLAAGMTLAAASKLIGVGPVYLSQVETGVKDPVGSARAAQKRLNDFVGKAAVAYGVEPGELAGS